jgi:hypothetical protein
MPRACAKPRNDELAHAGRPACVGNREAGQYRLPAEQFARAHASNRQFGLRPYISVAGCISGRSCHKRPAAWVFCHVGVSAG